MSRSEGPPGGRPTEDATPRPGDIETPIDPDELVAEDDAVIGRALRRSLAGVVLVGVVVAAGIYLGTRPTTQPPPETTAASAPRPVAEAALPPAVPFTDVTTTAGIRFTHVNGAYGQKLLPETMGAGVAFFDFDGDGDQDLVFVNGAPWPWAPAGDRPHDAGSALYLNDGAGRFSDATEASNLGRLTRGVYGMGVAAGDYDRDGNIDLFITAVGENRLLRNTGRGFEDVTSGAGVAGSPTEWSTGAAFFDMDGDGDLDLFVGNYVRWSQEIDLEVDFRLTGVGRAYGPPQTYEGRFPYLYRNDGGVFVDVTAGAGLEVRNPATGLPMGKALAVAPVDLNTDGRMDLVVANDTIRNFAFLNRGDGVFDEVGEIYGLAYDRNGNATGAMGIDAGYFRNDRDLGFFIGNFANEMTSVFVAQGDPGLYVDEAITEGIGAPSRRALSFGLFLFDYDLDGRLDVLQVDGHLEEQISTVDPSQSYRQPAQLYWNAGDTAERRFVLVPAETTGDLARPVVGRASAYADIDGDGDLDVVLTQAGDAPLLLRNDQATGHHWLRVALVGADGARGPIGARVELTAGGVTQRRQVMPTRSYLAQVELPITFGLGTTTEVERLVVTWPDGVVQEVPMAGAPVDRLLVVEAPAGR